MIVKIKKRPPGPYSIYKAGDIIDITKNYAKELIAEGYAVDPREKKAKKKSPGRPKKTETQKPKEKPEVK